jgi:hypothetical protein
MVSAADCVVASGRCMKLSGSFFVYIKAAMNIMGISNRDLGILIRVLGNMDRFFFASWDSAFF